MYTLAEWLKDQIQAHGLTQQKVSVYAGVSGATLSDMLNRGHIPKMELLFRLADYFETPREQVLRLAARMPIEASSTFSPPPTAPAVGSRCREPRPTATTRSGRPPRTEIALPHRWHGTRRFAMLPE